MYISISLSLTHINPIQMSTVITHLLSTKLEYPITCQGTYQQAQFANNLHTLPLPLDF